MGRFTFDVLHAGVRYTSRSSELLAKVTSDSSQEELRVQNGHFFRILHNEKVVLFYPINKANAVSWANVWLSRNETARRRVLAKIQED